MVAGSDLTNFKITSSGVTTGQPEVVINDDSVDMDFRVESNGNANMLFVDGGNDRVGIGTATAPHQKLTITGDSGAADGNLTNGILALTTGSGGINDTRVIFGIVDDDYAYIQPADYGVAYRNLILNPNGGNVGIDNTSPTAPLDITANVNAGFIAEFHQAHSSGYGLQVAVTGSNLIFFYKGGANIGNIVESSGGVSYGTSSDYRLKENVTYDFDATTRLKQLKPSRFNFKANPNTTLDGFLAHEVSAIVPEAITGEKDATRDIGTIKDAENNLIKENAYEHEKNENQTWTKTGTENVYQNIDQSKLVPLLVKTIQELEVRITALESA
jgi:hypothetical protein